MEIVKLGTGLQDKKLYVLVTESALWKLIKIDLLAKEPFIRFLRIEYDGAFPLEEVTKLIRWDLDSPNLGIVIHKAVVARIIRRFKLEELKDFINKLASRRPEGPIQDGFLSNEHGRVYLMSPTEGWGWRLERTRDEYNHFMGEHVMGNFYVERFESKRTRRITESEVCLSVFGSMLIPVDSFKDSLLQDFGSFADPYSLKQIKISKLEGIGDCVDIPLARKGQQLKLQQEAS